MGAQQSNSCFCSRPPPEAADGERDLPRLQPTRQRAAGDRKSVSTSSSEFGKRRLSARGTLASPILRTNSSPALLFEAHVRPKWFPATRGEQRNPKRLPLDDFKREQRRTLEALRERASRDAWREIHALHFDWWMFPIEDGRRAGFNVLEADAAELGADLAWRTGYVEGVELVCRAWGWDAKAAEPLGAKHDDQTWSWWDVRLAKMIRSLWLFEEDALLLSLQKLARTIKPDGGFRYGTVNLDEILYMAPTLPLLCDDRPRTRSWRARSEDQQP